MISIVVCTYNRDKYIKECLFALTNQGFDKDSYEVVIVNNNSMDNTENICKQFAEENKNIKYIFEKRQGLSYARNTGIKNAKGELIAFIDDDGIAESDYLKEISEFFEQNPAVDAIGGKVIPVYEDGNEPEWLSKYLWGLVTKIDYGERTKRFPRGRYPVGCNMIIRKNIFDEIGYFDQNLGRIGRIGLASEEKDLFYRIKTAKKEIYYVPNIVVHHHIDSFRLTFDYFKKLSLGVGLSERIRTQKISFLKAYIKLLEFVFKFCAAIILSFLFLFKFEPKKAYYIILFRLYVLMGFFEKLKT